MSGVTTQSNVEQVQRLYTAMSRSDVRTVLAGLADDVMWRAAEGFPYGGTYLGPESVAENVLVPLGTEWTLFRITPERFIDAGDTVVVTGMYSGTYRETGESFEAPFAHVLELRGGKVTQFHQYTDTYLVQQAL